jgi:Domain of unknown function (DUF4430)
LGSRRLALLAAVAALGLAGCGLGAGTSSSGVSLTVTDGFGKKVVVLKDDIKTHGEDTVMRLLQRNAKVTTRFGGGFVQSVNGLSGQSGSSPIDWFFFVNGSEGSKGSASVRVHAGDQVWWDRHDWSAAMDVPAVVGSYPEPFLHGLDGKRLPVRIECSPANAPGCKQVSDLLGKAGVVAARGGLAASFTKETLRVLVGLWPAIHEDTAAKQIERGPQTSGVFARMSPDGRTLALLDASGHVARTLGPGTGLIAATSFEHGRPVWVVTGTDVRGLTDAAESLQAGVLRNRFALVTDQGKPLSAPER